MKTKDIHQVVFFKASPEEVYNLLMQQEKHASFTGSEASISTEVNGTFEVYNGYCHGTNIELIPNQKIVQNWHFAEEGWPDNHFSKCTFLLELEENQTKLTFDQTEVPEHVASNLEKGWEDFYWSPMKNFFQS